MDDFSIASITACHRASSASIVSTVADTYRRIAEADDPAIFISIRDEAEVIAEAAKLAAQDPACLPLFGVPIAVKDNIDVAGMPTTAACPAFSYMPQRDATAVARLRAAGALIIGKTNLDQFATGLVGVRSPYGVPRNALRAELVPGGSSSGSGVAVARGIVPLALGTDTAGSGRIPAGLNNIVGLKPSLGLVSSAGVVPACRSLDCVSIFSMTASDAYEALRVMAGEDFADAYTRSLPLPRDLVAPQHLRLAVPRKEDRIFFGDKRAEAAFANAIALAQRIGWQIEEIEITPLLDTARLLYEGAWVAERTAAVGEFIARHPNETHPVTKAIIEPGTRLTAVDAFRGFYKLAGFAQRARRTLARFDALMVPTAPTNYTLADLANDPIGPNSRLGTYTNFVNLLDLCGMAVPSALSDERMPDGVTFLAAAGRDAQVAAIGAAFHAATGLPLGALGAGKPPQPRRATALREGEVAVAVVGAHLTGMPLNHELVALNGRLLAATATAPEYRLFALSGTTPPKPGLLRVNASRGASIAIETWALAPDAFGRFVAGIPSPLSIGSVRLRDGEVVKGFLVEAEAVVDAKDVSEHGGWRAALAAMTSM